MDKNTKKWAYATSSRTILADLYTPVGVYMHLRDIYPQSALMESSDYHDANNSRSFIGINPIGGHLSWREHTHVPRWLRAAPGGEQGIPFRQRHQ